MKLLVQFRIKHLISTRLFVSWLADTLATANLAQVGFVAQLIGDLLPEMSRHTTIARVCVRAACAKIDEV
jgi:mediator of RNA polymerase II transcription subunit 12